MPYIKNTQQLLSRGNPEVRKVLLEIIEAAIAKADPYRATKELVQIQDDQLMVGDLKFDLKPQPRIYIIGTGKATFPIARALEDILGDRITDGLVICKYGQQGSLGRSKLYLSSHPIPDESGLKYAKNTLALAGQTRPGDIVLSCITGGSSALMPLPVSEVSLEEKKKVNKLLLTCGANIMEINAVRKHLSQIKGGFLAQRIHPQARLINLTVSDVIGDALDYITCPTVPDTSTFDDARATMTKYDLWEKVPASVRNHLKNGGPHQETPKAGDLADHLIYNFVLLGADAACWGAAEKARQMGLETMVLSTMLEGESKELGGTFAAIAKETLSTHQPLVPPCVIIGGGETTVKIDGVAGSGGPNQEFAVAVALGIDNIGNVGAAGVDSDGTDGPTDLAGGLVDAYTLTEAAESGIDLFACLQQHDVSTALKAIGGAIETGATGTNVNDLKIMVILPKT